MCWHPAPTPIPPSPASCLAHSSPAARAARCCCCCSVAPMPGPCSTLRLTCAAFTAAPSTPQPSGAPPTPAMRCRTCRQAEGGVLQGSAGLRLELAVLIWSCLLLCVYRLFQCFWHKHMLAQPAFGFTPDRHAAVPGLPAPRETGDSVHADALPALNMRGTTKQKLTKHLAAQHLLISSPWSLSVHHPIEQSTHLLHSTHSTHPPTPWHCRKCMGGWRNQMGCRAWCVCARGGPAPRTSAWLPRRQATGRKPSRCMNKHCSTAAAVVLAAATPALVLAGPLRPLCWQMGRRGTPAWVLSSAAAWSACCTSGTCRGCWRRWRAWLPARVTSRRRSWRRWVQPPPGAWASGSWWRGMWRRPTAGLLGWTWTLVGR